MIKEIPFDILASARGFLSDLSNFLSFDKNEIERLSNYFNKESSFGINESEKNKIIKEFKISKEVLSSFMRISEFFHEQLLENDIDIDEFIDEFHTFLKKQNFSDFEEKLGPIKNLLVVKESHVRTAMRLEYSSSVLERLKSISSIVDIRPIFSKDEKLIYELIPVILLKITVVDEDDEEKSINFQITEEDLKKIIDNLSITKNKIKNLNNKIINKIKI